MLIDSATTLINSVMDALPTILASVGKIGEILIDKITDIIPQLLSTAIELVTNACGRYHKGHPEALARSCGFGA